MFGERGKTKQQLVGREEGDSLGKGKTSQSERRARSRTLAYIVGNEDAHQTPILTYTTTANAEVPLLLTTVPVTLEQCRG